MCLFLLDHIAWIVTNSTQSLATVRNLIISIIRDVCNKEVEQTLKHSKATHADLGLFSMARFVKYEALQQCELELIALRWIEECIHSLWIRALTPCSRTHRRRAFYDTVSLARSHWHLPTGSSQVVRCQVVVLLHSNRHIQRPWAYSIHVATGSAISIIITL